MPVFVSHLNIDPPFPISYQCRAAALEYRMTKPSKESEIRVSSAAKKFYTPPQLFKYGTLREITLTAGNSGSSDNGSGSLKKTSP
jgi:hypothetical protein